MDNHPLLILSALSAKSSDEFVFASVWSKKVTVRLKARHVSTVVLGVRIFDAELLDLTL